VILSRQISRVSKACFECQVLTLSLAFLVGLFALSGSATHAYAFNNSSSQAQLTPPELTGRLPGIDTGGTMTATMTGRMSDTTTTTTMTPTIILTPTPTTMDQGLQLTLRFSASSPVHPENVLNRETNQPVSRMHADCQVFMPGTDISLLTNQPGGVREGY
jgi:hypothetical protein